MLTILTDSPSTTQVEDSLAIAQAFEAGEWTREDATVRVCLRDEQGFGVQVPATLSEKLDSVTFILPEQLNVFDPNLDYFLAVEVILPGLLLIPTNLSVKIVSPGSPVPQQTVSEVSAGPPTSLRIAPGGPGEAENIQNDLDPVPESEGANEAYRAITEGAGFEEFPGLDEALAVVAPMPINQEDVRGRVKLEEISAEVIEEALWKRKEAQPASRASAPHASPGLKKALKNLLRL